MSLASFIRVAQAEVGNGPAKYLEMFNATPGTAWCAMFVSWCAVAAEIMTTADSAGNPYIKKTARVAEMKLFYDKSKRYAPLSATPGTKGYPEPGDIAFFLSDGQSHVGIIVEVSGNTIKTVEGNTSMPNGNNGVAYQTYNNPSTGTWKITGIGNNSAF